MNKFLSLTSIGMMLSLATSLATAESAYQSGDMMLRFGSATVVPDTKTGSLSLNGVDVGGSDLVDVDAATALGFSFTYMFMPLLGIEILAATPFSHDIETELNIDASTKQLPPTVSLQYYPIGNKHFRWQPYLGLGLNYTAFFDEDIDLANADFSLDDSWGVAVSAGLDWLVADHWFANLSVMWIDINTEANIDVNGLARIEIADVELDPWVYRINAGYRF